jgi:ferritin-like metal-binding protein YciE
VGSGDLQDQLTKHIDEAIAMEQDVLRMLDSMIETTEDEQIKSELQAHKLETERQSARLRERLEAHGEQPSVVREAGGVMGAGRADEKRGRHGSQRKGGTQRP